jgi:membrane-anchored mycosin MYCP
VFRELAVVAALLIGGLSPAAEVSAAPACASAPAHSSSAVSWPQQRLDYARVWPLTQGQHATVAVVDSGVDGRQRQLAGRVEDGVDVLHGTGNADTDCVGHGTFVAGIVAAAPVSGVGFAGVAPAATILPIRQTDVDENGTADGLASGLRAAVDGGASIVNVSVVSRTLTPALTQAVVYAEQHDVLVVAAAANDAQLGNPISYPAASPTVLAVAAVGQNDQRSGFSEVGHFVALAAPGTDVVSVGPAGPGQLVGSGTSYAAPFVSGVAALVRAYHPDLTAAQVRHRLEVTADHPPVALPDPQVGWGVIDPYAAVTALLPEEHESSDVRPLPSSARPVAQAAAASPPPTRPLIVAAVCAAIAVLAAIASEVVRRGRRRKWRTGDDRVIEGA